MLSEAIIWSVFGIIAISVVFCCCTFGCYVLFQYLLTEVDPDLQPETPVWEAKHYYDPLPLSTPSPPDTICKPTPYSFKLQNGNGVYAASLPHAVINPAVLQYPPGHVLDQQRVAPPPPPAQQKPVPQKEKSRRHSQTRSRTPSPSPRRAKNVWSTDVDFHRPPPNDYSNHHHHHTSSSHHSPHQHQHNHSHLQHYKEFQQHQKVLQQQFKQHQQISLHPDDQSQYPTQQRRHHPPAYHEESPQPKQQHSPRHQHKHHHNNPHPHQPPEYEYDQSSQPQQTSAFIIASTHATNAYPHYHHHQRSYKSRLKDAVT